MGRVIVLNRKKPENELKIENNEEKLVSNNEEKPVSNNEEKLVFKNDEKLVFKNDEKSKPVSNNEEKLVFKNEEKSKPVFNNEEKLVFKNDEKSKPVLNNDEKLKPVSNNEEKLVFKNDEKSKPVSNNEEKLVFKNEEKSKPVSNNDETNNLNDDKIDDELDILYDINVKGSNADKKIKLMDIKIDNSKKYTQKILEKTEKLYDNQFKSKIIILQNDSDKTIDPSLECVVKGRSEYKHKVYEKLPDNLRSLDKSINKKSLFGNKIAPKNLTERFIN